MGTTKVNEQLVPPNTVINESATPTIADSENLAAIKPTWVVELATRWRRYHTDDLRLRYQTGGTINSKIGPPTVRQPRGLEVVRTLSIELGIDAAEISRMRHFAAKFDSFEQFRQEHPDATTWNRVKMLLAGNESGKQRTQVEALIGRIQTTTADLRKEGLELDEVDVEQLHLELRKLGRALETQARIRLTVARLPGAATV